MELKRYSAKVSCSGKPNYWLNISSDKFLMVSDVGKRGDRKFRETLLISDEHTQVAVTDMLKYRLYSQFYWSNGKVMNTRFYWLSGSMSGKNKCFKEQFWLSTEFNKMKLPKAIPGFLSVWSFICSDNWSNWMDWGILEILVVWKLWLFWTDWGWVFFGVKLDFRRRYIGVVVFDRFSSKAARRSELRICKTLTKYGG